MSFIANGLECTECGTIDPDVFYHREEGPPPCECGGMRIVSWAHGRFPGVQGDGYGTFVPVDMGILGKCETREQYDRAVSTIKERFPNHRVELETETQAEKSSRVDEIRHRSWQSKQSLNLNDKMAKEISDTKQRLRAEEPSHTITKKSAAQLVGALK